MRSGPGRIPRPHSELHFHDSGTGSPEIVFTHGAGLDHTMFDDQAEALRLAGHRVITWDIPGHGRSRLGRVAGLIVLDSTWNTGPLTGIERVFLRLAAPLLALVPSSPLPMMMARASAMSRWAEFEGVRDHIITNAGHIVTLDSPAATSAETLRALRRWAP